MLPDQPCAKNPGKLQWYLFACVITLIVTAFLLQFSSDVLAQTQVQTQTQIHATIPPLVAPLVTRLGDATITAASKPCPPVDDRNAQAAESLKLSPALKDAQPDAGNDKNASASKDTAPCTPQPVLATVPAPIPKIIPHVALFLPLSNKTFATVADAVKVGFVTAATTDGSAAPAYRIYAIENEGDGLAAAYHKAATEGAVVAVAALTRDGATRIAKEGGSLPTLALNAPAVDVGTPKLFYYLSLGVDAEARQAAQLAVTDGFTSVTIVTTSAALSKRVHESFEREFTKLGREIKAVVTLNGDNQDGMRLRQNTERLRLDPVTDMFFLALDGKSARTLRPYLPSGIPVYATSMAFDARAGQVANLDMESVRLLEMPWSVQPDHPAVMIYAKPNQNFSAEQERLYALGVDAWRVASLLATTHATSEKASANRIERQLAPIDGVTGKLSFDITTRQFVRTLTAIELRNGQPFLYRGSE